MEAAHTPKHGIVFDAERDVSDIRLAGFHLTVPVTDFVEVVDADTDLAGLCGLTFARQHWYLLVLVVGSAWGSWRVTNNCVVFFALDPGVAPNVIGPHCGGSEGENGEGSVGVDHDGWKKLAVGLSDSNERQ